LIVAPDVISNHESRARAATCSDAVQTLSREIRGPKVAEVSKKVKADDRPSDEVSPVTAGHIKPRLEIDP
jgi:hypothetical protein